VADYYFGVVCGELSCGIRVHSSVGLGQDLVLGEIGGLWSDGKDEVAQVGGV